MNEHKNIITIEDEIKEFSDKPVKSSALFKALEEKGVPDASEASAGDVLSLDEDKKPTWAAPSGGGGEENIFYVSITESNGYVSDKTFAEIDAAFDSGKAILINGRAFAGRYYTEENDDAYEYHAEYTTSYLQENNPQAFEEIYLNMWVIKSNNSVDHLSHLLYLHQ